MKALREPRLAPEPLPGGAWSQLTAIDIHGCDRDMMDDEKVVIAFFAAVVPAIGMKAYDELIWDRFGEGHLYGITAIQRIMTSHIAAHADIGGHRDCAIGGGWCYRWIMDVHSCQRFDATTAVRVATAHFGGTPGLVTSIARGVA